MVFIRPFRGIRPAKDKAHLVVSRPVETYTKKQMEEKLLTNPYTFLHIIKPEFRQEKKSSPNSPQLLKKIKNRFNLFFNKKIFIQDSKECFYIYRQINKKHISTGIICCSSVDDYANRRIKIHEQVLTDRVEKLKNYLEICDFNAEPVLLFYRDDRIIRNVVNKITRKNPEYDFTTADGVRHKLWIVSDKKVIDTIAERFENLSSVYIADGHHRSASSALLAKTLKEKNLKYSGNEPYNFFSTIFLPESQLKIYEYNRMVMDLNGLDEKNFIDKLNEKFIIENKGEKIYYPKKQHNFSMYLGGKWYSLIVKPECLNKINDVKNIDTALLSHLVLEPILNITSEKTDKRIRFINGTKGLLALKKIVDTNSPYAVAFGLYPIKISQLKKIADAGKAIPPKTTWVEPKIRSGLVIYSLDKKIS